MSGGVAIVVRCSSEFNGSCASITTKKTEKETYKSENDLVLRREASQYSEARKQGKTPEWIVDTTFGVVQLRNYCERLPTRRTYCTIHVAGTNLSNTTCHQHLDHTPKPVSKIAEISHVCSSQQGECPCKSHSPVQTSVRRA